MNNMDSLKSLTGKQVTTDRQAKVKFSQSPSQAQLNLASMTKDHSVTKLGDVPLIAERAVSMEKIPTIAQALAGVPISPSNNTIGTFETAQT